MKTKECDKKLAAFLKNIEGLIVNKAYMNEDDNLVLELRNSLNQIKVVNVSYSCYGGVWIGCDGEDVGEE